MTALELLAVSRAAPEAPDGRGAEDSPEWARIEFRLGLALPTDFRRLVAMFGRGPWADFIHVLSPFTANEFLHFERAAHRHLAALHSLRLQERSTIPFALYPEAGGLLPWAVTDNGDLLCWLTVGHPDDWPTVVLESRGPQQELLSMPVAELILGFVQGSVPSAILLEPFEGATPGAAGP